MEAITISITLPSEPIIWVIISIIPLVILFRWALKFTPLIG